MSNPRFTRSTSFPRVDAGAVLDIGGRGEIDEPVAGVAADDEPVLRRRRRGGKEERKEEERP